MRSFRKNTFLKISAGLIVLLILGQVVGSLTMRYLFIQQQIKALFPQLLNISEDISATGDVHMNTGNFIIKAYDENYEKIGRSHSDNKELNKIDAQLEEDLSLYTSKVLSGETVAEVKEMNAFSEKSIILGTPIYKNNQIIGAAFLLKPATDYNAALVNFYLVFFCVTFLSGGIILFILRLYLLNHEKLEQTRRTYIANVSHELRTPISSVKALSETLCDGMITDEQTKQRYYHIIRNETFRLEKLIQDMLELSRLQSGKNALEKSDFSGAQLMEEVVENYGVLATDMGLVFVLEEKAKALPLLYSNYDRMAQVLHILLDNAFKFCGDEGRVTIDAEINRKSIKVFIKNTGEVIEPKDIPFIFDRFFKSNKSHNSKGSGLGLPIAKEILEALGEKIEVTSEDGHETVFSFTIQRAL